MIPFVVGAMLLQTMRTTPPAAMPVPFGVGEILEYSGDYSIFTPGSATMKVLGIDTVRGAPSWHFALTMKIDFALFHNRTDLASWTGTNDFYSRRFTKVLDEKDATRNDDFRIYPDSEFFRNRADTTKYSSPKDPIDDLAFIYYLRTARFTEHTTDTIQRYFRKSLNPVIIEVLGHEMIETGGVRRYCWVLHPIVEEPNGMFSKGRDARIWLSDDGLRLPVQIRSKYGLDLTLRLKKFTPGR